MRVFNHNLRFEEVRDVTTLPRLKRGSWTDFIQHRAKRAATKKVGASVQDLIQILVTISCNGSTRYAQKQERTKQKRSFEGGSNA